MTIPRCKNCGNKRRKSEEDIFYHSKPVCNYCYNSFKQGTKPIWEESDYNDQNKRKLKKIQAYLYMDYKNDKSPPR